jgi:hypothetical protein
MGFSRLQIADPKVSVAQSHNRHVKPLPEVSAFISGSLPGEGRR